MSKCQFCKDEGSLSHVVGPDHTGYFVCWRCHNAVVGVLQSRLGSEIDGR